MIYNQQEITLRLIGLAAQMNANWQDYSRYCLHRNNGLRKDAFNILKNFIDITRKWTLKEKKEFVTFLLAYMDAADRFDYDALPQLLVEAVIEPTLEEWCIKERKDSRPFIWYGQFSGKDEPLYQALEMDSQCDAAREQLIKKWGSTIDMNLHELPLGYLGKPQEDLILAEKARHQIALLINKDRQDYWQRRLEEDWVLICNYLDWQKSGHGDFKLWGEENNRVVG